MSDTRDSIVSVLVSDFFLSSHLVVTAFQLTSPALHSSTWGGIDVLDLTKASLYRIKVTSGAMQSGDSIWPEGTNWSNSSPPFSCRPPDHQLNIFCIEVHCSRGVQVDLTKWEQVEGVRLIAGASLQLHRLNCSGDNNQNRCWRSLWWWKLEIIPNLPYKVHIMDG